MKGERAGVEGCGDGVRLSLLWLLKVKGERSKVKGRRGSKVKGERCVGMGSGFPYCRYLETEDGFQRTDDRGRRAEDGGWVIGFVVLGI